MEIFDYDNVLLLPRKCRVESRSECDAGVTLGSRTFRLPVVPANMKTVVDESICVWMAQNGYFYVMHRFDLDNVQFVRDMHAKGVYASISLGVKAPDRATVDQLAAEKLVKRSRPVSSRGRLIRVAWAMIAASADCSLMFSRVAASSAFQLLLRRFTRFSQPSSSSQRCTDSRSRPSARKSWKR